MSANFRKNRRYVCSPVFLQYRCSLSRLKASHEATTYATPYPPQHKLLLNRCLHAQHRPCLPHDGHTASQPRGMVLNHNRCPPSKES